eukprot:gnl/TRDRNA2_/TRDRNA2_172606_c0_seq4.p1 gnl/TRDRNA2_/TRDRNA2_172606_c0~~gnl/TRDRNA2_/TRDRNA2_172606_c0_seq4.p1  ORF type:complete len:237 (-),score=19.59 gnl/TRDRNA2_/TRDRNA2_172606_c0_seq4:67-777(-)
MLKMALRGSSHEVEATCYGLPSSSGAYPATRLELANAVTPFNRIDARAGGGELKEQLDLLAAAHPASGVSDVCSEDSSTNPNYCSICTDVSFPTTTLECCGDGILHNRKTICSICIVKQFSSRPDIDLKCPFCRGPLPNSLKWYLLAVRCFDKSVKAMIAESKQYLQIRRLNRPYFYLCPHSKRGAIKENHFVLVFLCICGVLTVGFLSTWLSMGSARTASSRGSPQEGADSGSGR